MCPKFHLISLTFTVLHVCQKLGARNDFSLMETSIKVRGIHDNSITMAISNQDALKTAREKLYKLKNLRHFEGVNHIWTDLDQEPNFEMMHQKIHETKFKPNDIIAMGYPRSGNHWVYEILHMIFRQTLDFSEDMMFEHAFEAMATNLKKKESEESKDMPKFYTGHLTLDKLSPDFLEKGVKVIYILRNPKDAIVSFHDLMTNFKDERITMDTTLDEFIELQMTGEVPWGGWFDHIIRTDAFMKEHSTCPVFVLQFEKLKENPAQEIRELCEFLGTPTDLADQVAERTSFLSMKENTKEKFAKVELEYSRKGWYLIAQGKVGSWKNKFTVAQNERFNEHFETVCLNNELANRVREYIM